MASLPKDPVCSSLNSNHSQNSPSCTRLFARNLSPPPGMSPQNTGTWSVPSPQPTPGPHPIPRSPRCSWAPTSFRGPHPIPQSLPYSWAPTQLPGPALFPAPTLLPSLRPVQKAALNLTTPSLPQYLMGWN